MSLSRPPSSLIGVEASLAWRSTEVMDKGFWRRAGDRGRPLVIAHRGGAGLATENTAAAFAAAARAGADAVETDLRLTAEGRLVCVHDAELTRLAGQNLEVAGLTLDGLRRVLPDLMTLGQAIAASRPLGLVLDLKLVAPADLARVLAVLNGSPDLPRCVLGLRTTAQLALAGGHAGAPSLLALVEDPDDYAAAAACGAHWFRLWARDATPARLAAIRAAGLASIVMLGVAEGGGPAFALEQVLEGRPDAVMLDDPRCLAARPAG